MREKNDCAIRVKTVKVFCVAKETVWHIRDEDNEDIRVFIWKSKPENMMFSTLLPRGLIVRQPY